MPQPSASAPAPSPKPSHQPASGATGPDTLRALDRLRPRLRGLAYRMLGSMAEAEEVVQDALLRWHQAAPADVQNAEAWMVTVTTRLAIDRFRAAKAEREHYSGLWLPEPVLGEAASLDTPESTLAQAQDLSVAFLAVLERLGPEARAAFLLREVFDVDYAELATILGKSEAACRQLVHRAKAQLQDDKPRYRVPPQDQQRLLQGFSLAVSRGDFAGIQGLLAEQAELIGDGGDKVPSFGKPLEGGQRIAQLYYASVLRHGADTRLELAWLNGQWGLLRFIDGKLESAQEITTDGQRILRIHAQRNPDKLAALARQLGVALLNG